MMVSTWRLNLTLVLIAFATCGSAVSEDDALAHAKDVFRAALPLAITNDRLSLDREAWDYPRLIDTLNRYLERGVVEAATANGTKRDPSGRIYTWNINPKEDEPCQLGFEELDGIRGRKIKISDDKMFGLAIQFWSPDFQFSFVQLRGGPASLLAIRGQDIVSVAAVSFTELLKKHADKIQLGLLRPLADLGVSVVPHKYLPTVMAVATGAYTAATPEFAVKANRMIAMLDSDEIEIRDKATRDLIALFPRAIFHITEAAKSTQDPEVKTRLEMVIAAHPGIAKARVFVEQEKLHENREYLLDLLANVPFFKSPARIRLTAIVGKDYGDDPAAWPKQ
jgi:hypothetical protein